jgi:chloramphenicol 3-O phosphotransferase
LRFKQFFADLLSHVSMDPFFDMLPERIFGDADGLVFETVQVDGMPSVVIRTGTVVERALRGMRHAVAALVEQGNSVVVDEVMIGQTGQEYRNILSRFDVRFMGLFAPLGILEARERERGDRQVGLA